MRRYTVIDETRIKSATSCTVRKRLGALLALRQQRRGTEQRLVHELRRDGPGQADEHPRLDERLGNEEHVRRTRSREPGHRVEQMFGQPHDEAEGTEQLLGEV